MKKLLLMMLTASMMTSCLTLKVTSNTTVQKPETAETQPKTETPATYYVEPHPDVITIKEAISLLSSPAEAAAIAKAHGYKAMGKYAIYRLDSYEQMMYKNCRLPKKLGENIYEDTPKPLAKGTSSYVALNGNVLIAVFNNTAYQNLVEQIKGLGFTLTEQGYEDKYMLGTTAIYVYPARKSIRIEKEG